MMNILNYLSCANSALSQAFMEWSKSGFGARLESALTRLDLTQKKFCAEHNFNAGTLSGWKETNEPSYEEVLRLAKGLEVRPAWLMFDDSFEPMDDEERELLTIYRKLGAPERDALRTLVLVMTLQRTPAKKPGPRTPKAASPSSLQLADPGLFSRLPPLSEVQKSEAGLLEHLSCIPIGTKAWNACEAAAIQLRRLIVALQSLPQTAPHKDSTAKPPATNPASAKSQPGRAPSPDQPLPFPPER